MEKLPRILGIRIYGDGNPEQVSHRLGVIPLQLERVPHFLAAAILGYEFGIGGRSGCFCAHPYILHLLGLTPEESQVARQRILAGDRSDMPGMVRASFGLYNTLDEVDALVEALERISSGKYSGDYDQDISSGEYTPKGWKPDFRSHIPFLEDNLNPSG